MKLTSSMLTKMAQVIRSVAPLRDKLADVTKLAEAQTFVLNKVADKQLDPSDVHEEVQRLMNSNLEVEKRAYEIASSNKTAITPFEGPIKSGLTSQTRTKEGWAIYNGEPVNPVEDFLLEVREDVYGIPNPLKN